MRKVDDPGTRAVVTSLVFAHDDKHKPSQGSIEGSEEELAEEDGIVEEPRRGAECGKEVEVGSSIQMKELSAPV